jgi:hypothetical protein
MASVKKKGKRQGRLGFIWRRGLHDERGNRPEDFAAGLRKGGVKERDGIMHQRMETAVNG